MVGTRMRNCLKKVAIVGGTHGNELSGINLVNFVQQSGNQHYVTRPSFETIALHSNVEAIKQCSRYVSVDLNRCFDRETLEKAAVNTNGISEWKRALIVNEKLGPKLDGTPKMDMIFDLHNTTSNCSVLLCFSKEDHFSREIAAYLSQFDPDIVTVFWPQNTRDEIPFLPSVGKSGMTVEVGPLPHGTMNYNIYERTFKLLQRACDYIEYHNQCVEKGNDDPTLKQVKLNVAERVVQLDFPRDKDGNLSAVIHPDLQGIKELKSGVKDGSNIFMTLGGNPIQLDYDKFGLNKDETYYPMFVNEAAYYEKGVAFYLTKLKELSVPILSPPPSSKI